MFQVERGGLRTDGGGGWPLPAWFSLPPVVLIVWTAFWFRITF